MTTQRLCSIRSRLRRKGVGERTPVVTASRLIEKSHRPEREFQKVKGRRPEGERSRGSGSCGLGGKKKIPQAGSKKSKAEGKNEGESIDEKAH